MINNVELSNLYAKCDEAKQSWNSFYYEVFAYTQPERNYIWRHSGSGPANLKQVSLFTQAGKVGANVFVSRIQNKLSPIGKPYISFKPKKSLESDFIQQLRDFATVMSNKCNEKKEKLKIDEKLTECYYDLVAGSACLMRENSINGLNFKHLPLTDIRLGTEENQTVCRCFKLPACKIGVIFPELFQKNIQGIDLKGEKKHEEITLTDVLYYNEKNNIWEYYLRKEDNILLIRKYKKSPYRLFHWSKAGDMPFGSGVGLQALPALKRLNSYIKVNLELIPFSFPMFFATSGNFMDRNVTFKPGGIINVRDINAVQPVPMSTDRQSFMLEIQKEELDIKSTMLDYTLPNDPREMTAAEVYARSNPQDEMVQMNIARQTSVIKEIAWDIFDDIYERELRGVIEISLEDLHEMLDCEINNEASVDNNTIQKIQAYIQTVGMIDPQAIWQTLNRAKTYETLGKAYNLPQNITYTAEEIEERTQQDAEAQANMMQAQANMQMAIDDNKENAIANREIAKQQANQ